MLHLFTHILVFLAVTAVAGAADEASLWRIWVSHTNAAVDHATVADSCRAFRTKMPTDPLTVVAQGLEAWHLLKAGKTNDAARLLEPMAALSGDALQKAGAEMARSWLTRLDREVVRVALKRIYIRDIEFPISLEALKTMKKVPLPPMTDRWNQPWSYQSTELSTIKQTQRQRYILESSRLGPDSDFSQALAASYASRITIEPVRIMGGAGVGETVEFLSVARKSAALTVGSEMDGIKFGFIGKDIIILADKDHWRIVQKPR